MDKEILIKLAKEIQNRVEIAANGQRDTEWWSYADENLSAPDGMDYWEWIDDAEKQLLKAIEQLSI